MISASSLTCSLSSLEVEQPEHRSGEQPVVVKNIAPDTLISCSRRENAA